jgi:hypothetical protein
MSQSHDLDRLKEVWLAIIWQNPANMAYQSLTCICAISKAIHQEWTDVAEGTLQQSNPAYKKLVLVHPTDRTLAIYRLEDGRYGRPIYQELKGQTLLKSVPGVSVDWDRMMTRLM